MADALSGVRESIDRDNVDLRYRSLPEKGGLAATCRYTKAFSGYVDAKFDKTDTFFVDFVGKKPAILNLANLRNRGDLDLFVYTMDNKLVARDKRTNAAAHVSFTPPATSRYRVVVKAYKGPTPISYRLTTN